MIINRSTKPLYLMPGEIIFGGQQDRAIGQESIIPPGKKAVKIEVYCVESGRWAARDDAETEAAVDKLASPSDKPMDAKARKELAEEAKKGKFVAHAGNLSNAPRGWLCSLARVKGRSGTMSARQTPPLASRPPATPLRPTTPTPRCSKSFRPMSISCSGPRPSTSRWWGPSWPSMARLRRWTFQSTPLFEKLWPKLLKSHALDAFAVAEKPE